MKHSTQIQPISYLKNHAAEIASTLEETVEPLLNTQNGEALMVVMDVASGKQQEQTLAMLKQLAMSNREIEAGQFRDADEVLAELEIPAE